MYMVSDAADRQLVPPRQQSSDVSFEMLEELPTGMLN